MKRIYQSIVRSPGFWIVSFLAVVLVVSIWPVAWLSLLTPWKQSQEWARVVFQLALLIVVVVGGVVPIAKWHLDQSDWVRARVQKIIDDKPIVVTDRLHDGTCEIRNIGSAPALNVWMVVPQQKDRIPLGALDTHEARRLPDSLVTTLKQAAGGHMLLAAARTALNNPPTPSDEHQRPYTVTFNVCEQGSAFRHGLDEHPPKERLIRNGSIDEYLSQERHQLIVKLSAFAGLTMATSPAAIQPPEVQGL